MRIIARSVIAFAIGIAAGAATAQSFDVRLAGRVLGTLDYSPDRIALALDNTPMGVGDGSFVGTTRTDNQSTSYIGQSDERRIAIRFGASGVQRVTIEPASERTELSEPATVPAGVLDPVTGLGHVVDATDCPPPWRMYDGRRAVEIGTTSGTIDGGDLVCTMAYRVIAGPGHLSPFRFRKMRLTARYDLDGGAVNRLRKLSIAAGPFTVALVAR